MSISYVLVLLGLGVFGLAVWAMFWAIDDGQYDDLEAHGASILEDDEAAPEIEDPPRATSDPGPPLPARAKMRSGPPGFSKSG